MAEFCIASVFSDHCVLQREKNVSVFGEGCDGTIVRVMLGKYEVETEVFGGTWKAVLPPMPAGDGMTLKVSCGEEMILFQDVSIGEVYLAGGQSNMELELKDCLGGLDVLKQTKNSKVRFYYTQKNAYMDESFFEQEKKSGWALFGEESAQAWSAVGYFFAERLSKELNVTVGIIGCNWGGTSASAWMSREALLEDRDLASYIMEYDEAVAGKTVEEQRTEYNEYIEYQTAWDKRCAKCYEEHPGISWEEVLGICGPNQYPGPMNCFSPFRPAGLYECMLKRIMPYTIRGVLFYQGESDEHKPKMYEKLLKRMIRQWREDWDDEELPFLLVQLPMHRYEQNPDDHSWAVIREAQMSTYQTVKNTGIAVILDLGEFNEIHPKNKVPVGERLALQALYLIHHRIDKNEAFGPIYQSCIMEEGRLRLMFKNAQAGLVVQGELAGFEIASVDGNFVPAEAVISKNDIILYNPLVKHPMYARYCWTNYGEVSVYGANGIPLAGFRTSKHVEI